MFSTTKSSTETFSGGTLGRTGKKLSKETASLLETMCKDSKLSERTKRQLKGAVENMGTLPSGVQTYKASKSRPTANFLGTRSWRGGKRVYTERERELLFESYRIKSYGGYVRRLDKILKECIGDREAEKSQLQYKMEFYGRTPQQVLKQNGISVNTGQGKAPAVSSLQHQGPTATPEEERFAEIVQEIEEREEFIRLMERAGKQAQVETVKAQIGELIWEMKKLDEAIRRKPAS